MSEEEDETILYIRLIDLIYDKTNRVQVSEHLEDFGVDLDTLIIRIKNGKEGVYSSLEYRLLNTDNNS